MTSRSQSLGFASVAFEIKGAIRNVEETAPWDVIALAEAGDGFVKNAAFETALKMRFVEAMERLDAVSLDQLHKINGLVQHADSKTKLVIKFVEAVAI